jgi:hypothetical protein
MTLCKKTIESIIKLIEQEVDNLPPFSEDINTETKELVLLRLKSKLRKIIEP